MSSTWGCSLAFSPDYPLWISKINRINSKRTFTPMNLLMVSPHLPSPSWGAGTRSYHLLKALACKHNTSLLFLGNEQTDEIQLSLREINLKQVRQIPLQISLQRK